LHQWQPILHGYSSCVVCILLTRSGNKEGHTLQSHSEDFAGIRVWRWPEKSLCFLNSEWNIEFGGLSKKLFIRYVMRTYKAENSTQDLESGGEGKGRQQLYVGIGIPEEK